MEVFISWSKPLSREIASIFKKWLKLTIQSLEPWMSDEDIEKGTVGIVEIGKNLEKSSFGILVITEENLDSRWLHFEAGALMKSYESARICPLIVGLTDTDIGKPLSDFQYTTINKDDIFKLVSGMNKLLDGKALEDELLKETFEERWPILDKKINDALEKHKKTKATKKQKAKPTVDPFDESMNRILNEIRDIKRSQSEQGEQFKEMLNARRHISRQSTILKYLPNLNKLLSGMRGKQSGFGWKVIEAELLLLINAAPEGSKLFQAFSDPPHDVFVNLMNSINFLDSEHRDLLRTEYSKSIAAYKFLDEYDIGDLGPPLDMDDNPLSPDASEITQLIPAPPSAAEYDIGDLGPPLDLDDNPLLPGD